MFKIHAIPTGRILCAMVLFLLLFACTSSSHYLLANQMLSPIRTNSLPASLLASLPTTAKALPVFRDNTASYSLSSSPGSSQDSPV